MKTIVVFCLLTVVLLTASCQDAAQSRTATSVAHLETVPDTLYFPNSSKEGAYVLTEQSFVPDSNGIMGSTILQLPEFEKGIYYRPFSYANASGNRMAPVWFGDITELGDEAYSNQNMDLGAFLMLRKKDGDYLAILPVVSKMLGTTLSVTSDTFTLTVASYGTETVTAEAPLLAYANSPNPYEATHRVWALAKELNGVKGNVNWRSDKEFPEPYRYLGWCSWEHYRKNIDEPILLDAIRDIKSSTLPIRWVLVDNGYLDEKNQRLLSFGVNLEKFPNGWKPITDQKDDKIKWMGLWRNFNGYMSGVSPHHTMKELANDLQVVPEKSKGEPLLMPKIEEASAYAFYDAMTAGAKNDQFDFIKVDFQSDNWQLNKGTSNAILGVHYNNRALEESVKQKGLSLLNCIGMLNFNVFNQTHSNLIRSSMDYKTDLDRIDLTLVQNFTNAFWLGHIHWLDQDMFHTSYTETARLMAVSRAISGGPVYLSDEAKNIDDTYLKPLMYEDGKIIGTLAPGVPLPKTLMHDPYRDKRAFIVVAPLKNKSAAFMAVNLNRDTFVEGTITAADYAYAGAMVQPFDGLWKPGNEGLLLYDHFERNAVQMSEAYGFQLKTREEKLLQISPIRHGWAVIGNPDKYLSAGTVEIERCSDSELILTMEEPGSLLLWCKDKIPRSEQLKFERVKRHLWRAIPFEGQESSEYIIKNNMD